MDIPKFRYPFDGSFPVSLSFAAQSENQEIKDKFTQWGWSGHIGLDFGCPEGAQILSVDSGEVIQSGGNGDYGESVTVKHSWGTTLYAHLQQTSVKVGDSVSAGQPLGLSGHSGSAFGDHLHFAVLPSEPDSSNGFQGYVDPTPYLQKTAPEPVQVKEVIKEVPVEKVVEKEVVKEIKVIDQAEVDRQVQEKLKQNLDANCQKANQVSFELLLIFYRFSEVT